VSLRRREGGESFRLTPHHTRHSRMPRCDSYAQTQQLPVLHKYPSMHHISNGMTCRFRQPRLHGRNSSRRGRVHQIVLPTPDINFRAKARKFWEEPEPRSPTLLGYKHRLTMCREPSGAGLCAHYMCNVLPIGRSPPSMPFSDTRQLTILLEALHTCSYVPMTERKHKSVPKRWLQHFHNVHNERDVVGVHSIRRLRPRVSPGSRVCRFYAQQKANTTKTRGVN